MVKKQIYNENTKEKVIANVIDALHQYYEKQSSFKKTFPHQPAITKAIEIFDDEIDELIHSILDLIGVPREEDRDNKYDKENFTRSVCSNIIEMAAIDLKFKDPAIELILDWENITTYTSRVENHTWFYYRQLLEEHLTGYKNWNDIQT